MNWYDGTGTSKGDLIAQAGKERLGRGKQQKGEMKRRGKCSVLVKKGMKREGGTEWEGRSRSGAKRKWVFYE